MSLLLKTIEKLKSGMSVEDILREQRRSGMMRSLEKGKSWGDCESCGWTTVLVADLGLCGPCCFGEASTHNGNW